MTNETGNQMPEKVDLHSLNVAEEQRAKLRLHFPEVFTEGGKVDFDQLKTTLGEIVDGGKERYGMTWPGKAECFRTIQTPSRATVRPIRNESEQFDSTGNVIIEGDNLEVLKLLQKGYLGKVKMIYIDPPYNTGNDFIYPDNYSESLDTYLSYTGQADAEGKKFSTNPETDGRFHSKWLNMMYPRLFLARNLLREDGVIFISIGQTELTNLISICNEVFGEEQRVSICTRLQKTGGQKGKFFSPNTDYVLVYAKDVEYAFSFKDVLSEELISKVYTQVETSGPRQGQRYRIMGLYQSSLDPLRGCTNQRYYIECPDGSFAIPPGDAMPNENREGCGIKPVTSADKVWRWTFKKFQEDKAKGNVSFKKTDTSPLITPDGSQSAWNIYTKIWLDDRMEEGSLPLDMFDKFENRHSSQELTALDIPFDFAKPTDLVSYLARISGTGDGDIVLDFFAGSGTTGHSVLKLNALDGHRRNFILVQLPESLGDKNFPTVAEITKERVRRAIKSVKDEGNAKLSFSEGGEPDLGFRVFKLDSSNFKPWDGTPPEAPEGVAKQLELHVDHVLPDRSQEDILTELLLKSGFSLSTKIEAIQLAGKQVFSVEEGTMLVCLDGKLTPDVIKAMADMKPSRVICLDDGFQGNDQLKTNAVQTMKARGVLSFRTV